MRIDARLHREELIEATARIFTLQGYEAPLEQVLEERGLGRGTLYRHFRNRSALVAAVFRHQLDRLSEFVTEHCSATVLLRHFLTQHAASSQGVVGAVQMMAETGDLELLAPLKMDAAIIYEQVAANARIFSIARSDFNAADLRLVMCRLTAAANKDMTEDGFDNNGTECAEDHYARHAPRLSNVRGVKLSDRPSLR